MAEIHGGRSFTGITGHRSGLMVVEDAHGYVAPSENVQIIAGQSRLMIATAETGGKYVDVGDLASFTLRGIPMGKISAALAVEYPKAERKKARKSKQHFKGLRP